MISFLKEQLRINNPMVISKDYIESNLKSGKHVIVQFSEKVYDNTILSDLNEICSTNNGDLCVRFYDHYSSIFDCDVLQKIPDVKGLYLDCMQDVKNIHSLATLKHLLMLRLDIDSLNETEILYNSNLYGLITLIVSGGKKGINLEYLRDYKNLSSLVVSGKMKNIEKIASVSGLEFLSLNSVTSSIDFINELKKLRTLKFLLGAREGLNEIDKNEIEHLEIVRVRKFHDIGNISKFTKLKKLIIEDLAQLLTIDFQNKLENLESVKISNCKNLSNLNGLENLPSLKELMIYKTSIDFNKIISQERAKTLKSLDFMTTNNKIDKEISQILEQLEYK
jgi:protein phosphatase 1 regulatory subunit 7